MTQIFMHGRPNQLRIAVLDAAAKLIDLRILEQVHTAQIGDIYRARVKDVLPGMQAAFLDIGEEKKAFLAAADVHRQHGKALIQELVHEGEALYVQVIKEAVGTKSARVTTEISLAGRYVVYLPLSADIRVSRQITETSERTRLQAAVQASLTGKEGAIIRSEAAGISEEMLVQEILYLRSLWQEANEGTKQQEPPLFVLRATDIVGGYLQEFLDEQVSEIVVDSLEQYRIVQRKLAQFYPEYQERLRFYREKTSLFAAYGIDHELDRLLKREVPLANGAYLVIDQTEAMTVIDVNTGAFVGQGGASKEATILKTNLEAAAQVALQLRLRDIGGIVMIDFIDMKSKEDQEQVVQRLRRELARDRTPSKVAGMTKLGLVEMTRKRERPALRELLTTPCPCCSMEGRVPTDKETIRRMQEELKSLARGSASSEVDAAVVRLPYSLYQQFAAPDVIQIELGTTGIDLLWLCDPGLRPFEYQIVYAGSRKEAQRLYHAAKAP